MKTLYHQKLLSSQTSSFVWREDVSKSFEKEFQNIKTTSPDNSSRNFNLEQKYHQTKNTFQQCYKRAQSTDLNYKKAFVEALTSVTRNDPDLQIEIFRWIHEPDKLKITSSEQNEAPSQKESFIRIKCSLKEVLQFSKEGRTHDEKGNRIIYWVSAKPFYLKESYVSVKKEFIAFHGTGFPQGTPDNKADELSIKILLENSDAAYLITKKGLIIQFFDDNKGFGGLNNGDLKKNGLPRSLNRNAIGIEIVLNDVRNLQGEIIGVEDPNEAQIKAARELRDRLVQKKNINPKNIVTHLDAVKGVSDAHLDDIKNETIRARIGIPSKKENVVLKQKLRKTNSPIKH